MKDFIKRIAILSMVAVLAMAPAVAKAERGSGSDDSEDDSTSVSIKQDDSDSEDEQEVEQEDEQEVEVEHEREFRDRLSSRLHDLREARMEKMDDERKAHLEERLDEAKKKICENRSNAIARMIENMNKRREFVFDRISNVVSAVEEFYQSKNLSVADYDTLVAEVNAAKLSLKMLLHHSLQYPNSTAMATILVQMSKTSKKSETQASMP